MIRRRQKLIRCGTSRALVVPAAAEAAAEVSVAVASGFLIVDLTGEIPPEALGRELEEFVAPTLVRNRRRRSA